MSHWWAALRRLSADQRRVMVLFYIADLTVEEISREVGAPQRKEGLDLTFDSEGRVTQVKWLYVL